MQRRNIIGPLLAKLRFERGWSQEIMAARLQCEGVDISRDMLANMESGRSQITDRHLIGFQRAFGICMIRLFPPAVQELDEKLAQRENLRPLNEKRRRAP